MKPIFEAKYIDIVWADRTSALSIKESEQIPIKIMNSSSYLIEAITFSKINSRELGQLAFHVLDDSYESIKPKFKVDESKDIELLPVIDNLTGKKWWVEGEKWLSKEKCWGSEIFRSAGEVTLVIRDVKAAIQISTSSFAFKELELYLQDFRNDFWSLILNESSYIKGEAKNQTTKILDSSSIEYISKFIDFSSGIIKNPKKELREIQILVDIKRVRPVPRTFMEITTKGYQRLLTSRGYKDSYNIAENKYVYNVVSRIYILLQNLIKVTSYTYEIQAKKIQDYQNRLSNYSDFKTIDKEVVENEIEDLKKDLLKEQKNLNKALLNQTDSIEELEDQVSPELEYNCIGITTQLDIDGVLCKQTVDINKLENINVESFIFKLEENINDDPKVIKYRSSLISKESCSDISGTYDLMFDPKLFKGVLEVGQEYSVSAYIFNSEFNNKKRKYFNYVDEMKLLSNPSDNLDLSNKMIHDTKIVKLGKKQDDYGNKIQFWGSIKDNLKDEWIELDRNDSLSIEFDKEIFSGILKSYQEYKITGYIYKSSFNKINGGIIHKRFFKYISDINLIKSKIEDKIQSNIIKKQEIESTNWQRHLTNAERSEQEYEKKAITEAKNLAEKYKINSAVLSKEFVPLLSKLSKIKKQFESLNINADSYFPNSMTFIQNPNYQGTHKLYKEIMGLSGIDESLFLGIQEVEKIGILNISLIYERWCLLQILKILIETYNFLPEENWKHKLVKQTLSKGKNIKIELENFDTKRQITLWYEKELSSGKRPDFVLDIRSVFGREAEQHRLVIDAKFYENINKKSFGGISGVINNLYNDKNYSEDNKNSVFILHPSKNSVPQKKTPKDWAKNSYYGEVNMFDWDEHNPDHQYGAILLSPIIRSGNHLDDLHRLIGMFLQYGIEDNSDTRNKDNKLDPIVKEKMFCLVCGSDKYTWQKVDTKNGCKHWVICLDCHHFTIYNYCANCQNRLIKNGDYWTYHSTQALEPINIKCPSCGDLL